MGNYYVTPEDYARAKKNGIKKDTLEQRVNIWGWDSHRASTEPPRPQRNHKPYYELFQKHGISYDLFKWRVRNGMEPELAATKPKQKRSAKDSREEKEEVNEKS